MGTNAQSLDLPLSSARVPATTMGAVHQVEHVCGKHPSAHALRTVSCTVLAAFIVLKRRDNMPPLSSDYGPCCRWQDQEPGAHRVRRP